MQIGRSEDIDPQFVGAPARTHSHQTRRVYTSLSRKSCEREEAELTSPRGHIDGILPVLLL